MLRKACIKRMNSPANKTSLHFLMNFHCRDHATAGDEGRLSTKDTHQSGAWTTWWTRASAWCTCRWNTLEFRTFISSSSGLTEYGTHDYASRAPTSDMSGPMCGYG